MPWKTADKKTVDFNTPFSYNEVDYPAQWLSRSTPEEKSAIGLWWEEEPVPVSFNARFFYKDGDEVKPQRIEDIREQMLIEIKRTANDMLGATDWYLLRKWDTGEEVPSDIKATRDAIRAEEKRLEDLYNSSDFDSIQNVARNWPSNERDI